MRMRKAVSGLLALLLSMTVLVIPAMAFSDEDEDELEDDGMDGEPFSQKEE